LSQVEEAEAQVPLSNLAAAKIARRNTIIGIILACCIGVTNGSFLVPLKYAQKDVKGIIYVVSFGIGAELVRPTQASQGNMCCLL
jgi:hypothetical protein